MTAPVEQREAHLRLGVIVEKRRSKHPWGDWIWSPVAVYPGLDADVADWTVLVHDSDVTRYQAGFLTLTVHRKETEPLRLNLMLDPPELYVALRRNTDASAARAFPWVPDRISASSYEAQDWHDSDEMIIEKLPMPDAVAAFVQAFVEHHHVDEAFIKRRRDEHYVEEEKFGKFPIFTPITRQ